MITTVNERHALGWAGLIQGRPPYTKRQLDAVIKQGRERPRPLTYDETTRAARNRRNAIGDMFSMITWADRGFVSGPPDDRRNSGADDDDPAASKISNYGNFFVTGPVAGGGSSWVPAQDAFQQIDQDELQFWTPDALAIERMVMGNGSRAGCKRHRLEQSPGERGEGIIGLPDEFYLARRAMTRVPAA